MCALSPWIRHCVKKNYSPFFGFAPPQSFWKIDTDGKGDACGSKLKGRPATAVFRMVSHYSFQSRFPVPYTSSVWFGGDRSRSMVIRYRAEVELEKCVSHASIYLLLFFIAPAAGVCSISSAFLTIFISFLFNSIAGVGCISFQVLHKRSVFTAPTICPAPLFPTFCIPKVFSTGATGNSSSY